MSEPPPNHGLPQRPDSDGQRRAEQDGSRERAQHGRDADQQTNDKQKHDAAFDQRYRTQGIGRLGVTGWVNLAALWATFLDAYAHASPQCGCPAAPKCAAVRARLLQMLVFDRGGRLAVWGRVHSFLWCVIACWLKSVVCSPRPLRSAMEA